MEIKTDCGKYVAPEVNVIELSSTEVLCASGDNRDYSKGNFGW